MALTLGELAERIGCELRGDPHRPVTGVAPLDRAGAGDLSFLTNPRYRAHLKGSQAAAIILKAEDAEGCATACLISNNPYLSYARAASLLFPQPDMPIGIHPTASVHPDSQVHTSAWIGPQSVIETGAVIAEGVFVGPGCVVGGGASIGAHSRLIAHVTVCHDVRIGQRALLHPGAVIGSDGFGLANDNGHWKHVPQLGSVVIGDDVDIGANTTVDRGAIDDTILEDGVKLDNQIQVAHNVFIGAHTAIAGCVGIAGSARIGRRCTVGGGAGIAGHLEIADDTHITGMSFVTKSVPESGIYSSGMPLETNAQWRRSIGRYRQLDDMAKRIKALEKALAARTPD